MSDQQDKKNNSEVRRAALLKTMLKQRGITANARSTIVKRTADDPAPLSFAQERLWYLDQFEPGNTVYNITVNVALNGELNNEWLSASIDAVVARHDVLRSAFELQGDAPVQRVRDAAAGVMTFYDLSDLPPAEQENTRQLRIAEQAATRFDLQAGPLIRVRLIRSDAARHHLLVTMHHIISDAASFACFFDEISRVYQGFSAGGQPAPAPLAIQYGDYAAWERGREQDSAYEAHRQYWQRQLGGNLPILQLPADHPRPAVLQYEGDTRARKLPETVTRFVEKMCTAENATPFMVFLTVYYILLHRYSGQNDICVGTTIDGRRLSETQPLIGYFQNLLALRATIDPRGDFATALRVVRATVLDAFDHQEVPFEQVVEAINPARDPGLHPLFQTAFLFHQDPAARSWRQRLNLPDISAHPEIVSNRSARFDLTMSIEQDDEGYTAHTEFSTVQFRTATIERLLDHFGTLLGELAGGAVATPVSALRLLPESEHHRLMVEWNNTRRAFPAAGGVYQLFAEKAGQQPERLAVRLAGGEMLSYGELNARANHIAAQLLSEAAQPNDMIGVCMARTPQMLATLLGIWKAGCTYVPLDPAFPSGRLAHMISDAGLRVIISDDASSDALPAFDGRIRFPDVPAADSSSSRKDNFPQADAARIAYVIYTSGSTGKPKGVKIPHRAAINFLRAMQEKPGFSAEDTLLAVTTLSFDISVLELFLPLISGGTVLLADRETAANGSALLALLKSGKATIMQATPATWRMLIDAGWEKPLPLTVLCGGEAMPVDLAGMLRSRCATLWNMYGPTETTVWSAVHPVSKSDGAIPIGRPIANTVIHILDAYGQLAPIGVSGELYIGGEGLAEGYHNMAALTEERFAAHAAWDPASRLYRTGDLARWRHDGVIEYLGRRDQQVKIRGFRIELGEIEAVLGEHAHIAAVAVADREFGPGDRRLTAYLVAENQQRPRAGELRRYLREKLPDYMIPSYFQYLDALPQTPNGKIDRNALPAPGGPLDRDAAFAAPQSAAEQQVAAIWRRALDIERISRHDNFFDLGGHSLLSIKVLREMEGVLNHRFNPRDILLQTLGQLVAMAEQATSEPQAEAPAAPRDGLLGRLRTTFRGSR